MDKMGRKAAGVASQTGMGAAFFMIGFLPMTCVPESNHRLCNLLPRMLLCLHCLAMRRDLMRYDLHPCDLLEVRSSICTSCSNEQCRCARAPLAAWGRSWLRDW